MPADKRSALVCRHAFVAQVLFLVCVIVFNRDHCAAQCDANGDMGWHVRELLAASQRAAIAMVSHIATSRCRTRKTAGAYVSS